MVQPALKMSELGYRTKVSFDYADVNDLSYDVYHFQRITQPSALKAMEFLKENGKVIMMDMDDDLFNLYPGHPSSWYFRSGKECFKCHYTRINPVEIKCPKCGGTKLEYQDRLGICGEALHLVDLLTVTTDELKANFGGLAKNCTIIPNYVDMNIYNALPTKGDDYLAVGWAGSFTHTIDLTELVGWLGPIDRVDNAYFFATGIDPTVLAQKFTDGFSHKDKLVLLDPVELQEYPYLLTNFDIGLAPLVDNLFNRSKSPLKAIEYGAVGIPVIASDVGPYAKYVEHGKTGFLVKKQRDWSKYIGLLINDKELREEMGRANYMKSMTMDINRHIHERIAIYEAYAAGGE